MREPGTGELEITVSKDRANGLGIKHSEGRGKHGSPGPRDLRWPRAPTENRPFARLDGRISRGVCGLPRDHSKASTPTPPGSFSESTTWSWAGLRHDPDRGRHHGLPPLAIRGALSVFAGALALDPRPRRCDCERRGDRCLSSSSSPSTPAFEVAAGDGLLPKVLLIQFIISRDPYLLGVYHQAIGWGFGAASALALAWHLRRRLSWPWLSVFLVFGLAAATLSAGHVQSLIRIQFSSTLRPIDSWCLHSAHVYARFILLGTFVMLAALAWDVRSRARSMGFTGLGSRPGSSPPPSNTPYTG